MGKRRGSYSVVQTNTPPEEVSCSHVEKSVTLTKVRNILPHAVFGRCCECVIKENVHVCLKCGKQLCHTHSDFHKSKVNNHSISYSLEEKSAFCSICKIILNPDKHTIITKVVNVILEIINKQISKNTLTPVKAPKSPSAEVEEVVTPVVDTKAVVCEPTVKGLRNTGVTCYFNSVVQNLVQTPLLRLGLQYAAEGYSEMLLSKDYGTLTVDVNSKPSAMMSKYSNFLQSLDSTDSSRIINPYQIFGEMCSQFEHFGSGQQDSQEAFHAMLSCLISEEHKRRKNAVLESFACTDKNAFKKCSRETKKKVVQFVSSSRSLTFVDSIFKGVIVGQITCLTCKSVTKTRDNFLDLSVPLPKQNKPMFKKKNVLNKEENISKHQKKKLAKENKKKQKQGRGKNNSESDKVAEIKSEGKIGTEECSVVGTGERCSTPLIADYAPLDVDEVLLQCETPDISETPSHPSEVLTVISPDITTCNGGVDVDNVVIDDVVIDDVVIDGLVVDVVIDDVVVDDVVLDDVVIDDVVIDDVVIDDVVIDDVVIDDVVVDDVVIDDVTCIIRSDDPVNISDIKVMLPTVEIPEHVSNKHDETVTKSHVADEAVVSKNDITVDVDFCDDVEPSNDVKDDVRPEPSALLSKFCVRPEPSALLSKFCASHSEKVSTVSNDETEERMLNCFGEEEKETMCNGVTDHTKDDKTYEVRPNVIALGFAPLEEDPLCNGADNEDDDQLCGLFDNNSSDEMIEELEKDFNNLDVNDVLDVDCEKDSLEACLYQFCKEELLEEDNQFGCLDCAKHNHKSLNYSQTEIKEPDNDSDAWSDSSSLSETVEKEIKPVKRDAIMRLYLHVLPPVLVFHLKRFSQDNYGRLTKDRRDIKFGAEINLDKFMYDQANVGNDYKLYGVVEHSGSLHRGHYISYVRKRNQDVDTYYEQSDDVNTFHDMCARLGSVNNNMIAGKWYCCDDSRIYDVPLSRVLSSDAYLLFYERCDADV